MKKRVFLMISVLLATGIDMSAQTVNGITVTVCDTKSDASQAEPEKAQFQLSPTETVVFDENGVATMTYGEGTEAIAALPMKYSGELHVVFSDYNTSTIATTNVIESEIKADGDATNGAFATLYSAFQLVVPEDVEVFTPGYSTGHVWINDDLNVAGKTVPVRTALLIKGTKGDSFTFGIDTSEDPYEVTGNKLDGNSVDIPVDKIKTSSSDILLTYGRYNYNPDGGYTDPTEWGFFQYYGDEIKSTKAYIKTTASAGAKSAAITYGYETDGVEEINVDDNVNPDGNDSDIIYNVAGQRVGENYRGVIIKNGKKYIQK